MRIFGKITLKNVAYSLSGVSLIILLFYLILPIPEILSKSNAFSDYLGLISGLSGVIVTITIFLIQNSTQNYSSQLIRMTFFKNKYFGFILFYILFSLSFFIYGLTFEISQNVKFLGFFLSFGLIFNFVSLLIISSYYMNLLNVIKEIELQIIKYIDKRARIKRLPLIGNIGFEEISTKKVANDLIPLFDTLKKSILLNQNDISSQCLRSLDNIIKFYLEKTSDFQAIEDNVLSEVSDQISFLIDSTISSGNQKFMDKLSIFIGNIGEYALVYRKPMGDINNHALNFSRLLVGFFMRSYQFDRTSAPKKSIKGISKLVKTCLNKEYFRSSLNYYYDLEQIIDLCLKKPNFWSSVLIAYTLNEYKAILNECVILSSKDKQIPLDLIENIFSKTFKVLIESNKSFSKTNCDIISRSMFGLHSLLTIISKHNVNLPLYKEIPKKILRPIIENYFKLCKNILLDKSINIDFMFLDSFPEFIFFTQYLNKEDISFEREHKELFNSLINRIILEIENSGQGYFDSRYFSCIEDYFAIIIYSKNVSLCEKQVDILVEKYKEIIKNKKLNEHYKNKFYGLLKIIGALMENEKEFDSCQEKINKIIYPHFKEYKQVGKALPSFFEEYDYYTFKHTFDEWFISPLSIWTILWQDQVNNYFNKKEKFINYNEKIKKLGNKK